MLIASLKMQMRMVRDKNKLLAAAVNEHEFE